MVDRKQRMRIAMIMLGLACAEDVAREVGEKFRTVQIWLSKKNNRQPRESAVRLLELKAELKTGVKSDYAE